MRLETFEHLSHDKACRSYLRRRGAAIMDSNPQALVLQPNIAQLGQTGLDQAPGSLHHLPLPAQGGNAASFPTIQSEQMNSGNSNPRPQVRKPPSANHVYAKPAMISQGAKHGGNRSVKRRDVFRARPERG